jgi:hypothetical protein
VLIRNNAPVFGANANIYSQPGEWQVSLTSRNLVSNDHYNGGVEQVQRQTLQNYVTNRQNLADLNVTRTMTERVTVSVGIPYVNSSWASRDPRFPLPAARREIEHNGRGLGDITVTGRYWLFDTRTHRNWNISAGTGLKLPTGNSEEQDFFVDTQGNNPQLRYVDQSVQPGDGGWGVLFEAAGFKRIGRVTAFGSGSYLVNAKNVSETPSITLSRLPPNVAPNPAQSDRFYNSVPDQYMVRLGGAVPVWKGFAANVAWRMEGLPRYDLIGPSNGFRRPGRAMFVEPGVSYSHSGHTFTFNVPLGYFYHRYPDPNTDRDGDATFPRHIFITSYTMKLGKKNPVAPPSTPAAPKPEAPKPPGDADQSATPQPSGGTGQAAAALYCPPALFSPL